ncbi:MAG: divalent-cation tolerance protein CutA [Gemmatimonadota bacterium]|nr:MAG: divalent-cation tolerance protein CutA [Gemmatimonadota bacterium]
MYVTVYITAGNKEEAERIARTAVEENLAACVNFFPCRSVYRWKGKVVEESEYILICKTEKRLFQQLRKRVREIHSYDVPAIVAYDIVEGEDEFLQWVSDATGKA